MAQGFFNCQCLGQLSPADIVCCLGVLFDSNLSFTNQVHSAIKTCFAKLVNLHHIRGFLSCDVLVMVANMLISSHLDYCSSLCRSLSSKNITRILNIQNYLACFVTGASRFTHITSQSKISSLASCEVMNYLQNLGAHIQVPHHWKLKSHIYCPIYYSVYICC